MSTSNLRKGPAKPGTAVQTRLPQGCGGPGAERTRGPGSHGRENLTGRTAARHSPARRTSPRVAPRRRESSGAGRWWEASPAAGAGAPGAFTCSAPNGAPRRPRRMLRDAAIFPPGGSRRARAGRQAPTWAGTRGRALRGQPGPEGAASTAPQGAPCPGISPASPSRQTQAPLTSLTDAFEDRKA